MKTLFALAVISATSLIILGTFGIQTGIFTVDLWVNRVMAMM